MSYKTTVNLTVQLKLIVDAGTSIQEVIDELNYNFNDTTTKATIEDEEIIDWKIAD